MTNKEKAQGLLAIASDDGRNKAERREAWNELGALKKQAKTSFEKLGVTEGQCQSIAAELADDFEMTEEELAAQKGRLKDLIVDEDVPLVEKDPLEEAVMPEQVAKKPDAVKAAKAAGDRGLITAETKRLLLETDDPYEDIVAAVKAKFPKAVTTNRSVASVASDLRKKGERVATRRKPAGEKA